MIPNIPMPTMNISSAAEPKTLLLNNARGIIGTVALTDARDREQQRDDRGGYGGGSEVVYLHPVPPGALVEHDGQGEEREDAERQIDVEDPPPGEVVRDPTSHRRADYAGKREDAEEDALILRPARGIGKDISDAGEDVG